MRRSSAAGLLTRVAERPKRHAVARRKASPRVIGAAAFAAILVAAGRPAHSVATLSSGTLPGGIGVTIQHTPNVVSITPQMGRQIAGEAVANLQLVSTALAQRDAEQASGAVNGTYLAGIKSQIAKANGKPIVVPSWPW